MSGVDVCVVCNADAESESWSSYIVQQASLSSSSASSVSSRRLLDTELSRPASADTLRTARVVVVVVSAGHLENLRRRCADPDRQVQARITVDVGLHPSHCTTVVSLTCRLYAMLFLFVFLVT